MQQEKEKERKKRVRQDAHPGVNLHSHESHCVSFLCQSPRTDRIPSVRSQWMKTEAYKLKNWMIIWELKSHPMTGEPRRGIDMKWQERKKEVQLEFESKRRGWEDKKRERTNESVVHVIRPSLLYRDRGDSEQKGRHKDMHEATLC